MITLEESSLMALVGNQICRCSIVWIACQEKSLSLTSLLIEVLCPAVIRKSHGLYLLITGHPQLLHLIGNSINLWISIMPKLANLIGTIFSKPNSIADNKPAILLEILPPQVYAMLETYIIYGALTPYHVE